MFFKKNKIIIILILCAILTPLTTLTAGSGWVLPSQPNNVPDDFNEALINITNWLLGFVVLIGILVMVWGGVKYVSSTGDQEAATTAKKTISYALWGVIIAGLAYAGVKIVVDLL